MIRHRRQFLIGLAGVALTTLVALCEVVRAGDAADCRRHDLSGKWSGCWISETTGHKGRLAARITRCGPESYRAAFTGTFFGVVPFRYAVRFDAVHGTNGVALSGGKHMGPIFGCFRFAAFADGCRLEAQYESSKDVGRFHLRRSS